MGWTGSSTATLGEFHMVEFQLRMQGEAVGDPMTIAIMGSPKDWRKRQTGGAVLLSSTPISKEEYLMKIMASHV